MPAVDARVGIVYAPALERNCFQIIYEYLRVAADAVRAAVVYVDVMAAPRSCVCDLCVIAIASVDQIDFFQHANTLIS